jgi:SAM-dependent methyltransferase
MAWEVLTTMDSYDNMVRFYEMEHETFLEDLDLYQGFAERCGGPVLELGCGTGRLLIPLAQMGYVVTGVDCSVRMLARAEEKMAALRPVTAAKITLIQDDMRTIRLKTRFPLIFIALNTFVHLLGRQDQQRTLGTVAHHLSPQGRLVIDLGNPTLLPALEEPLTLHRRWMDRAGGETIIKFTSTRYDPGTQLEELVLLYDVVDADGRVTRSVFPFTLRHTYCREMELLLEYVGLQAEVYYGSYDLDPYDAQSERMIVVARHAGG